MKILLFGDYSNVHWTLAEAYRKAGHHATVVSDGDAWKNYRRDIDIPYLNKFKFALFFFTMFFDPRFRGNDVVQLISYRFLFKNKLGFLNRFVFDFLKKHNKKIIMCACGDDFFYVDGSLTRKITTSALLEISPENAYIQEIMRVHHSKEAQKLNTYIAQHSHGIITVMYDYFVCYQPYFPDKIVTIPLPLDLSEIEFQENTSSGKVSLFIGVQKSRTAWKGTDVILKAVQIIKEKYQDLVDIHVVENVPYEEYVQLFSGCHLFFDQVYSYGQGMNGIMAMAKGKILFGGGGKEHYQLLGENSNFPIVDISPDVAEICKKIEHFILHPEILPEQGRQSRKYVEKHHDSTKVAHQFLHYYQKILSEKHV